MDNRLSILVLTCDAYSDLWNDFFTLKEKFWPDCPFRTYLITESKGYKRNGVSVMQMGKSLNWSGRLREALKRIDTPLVLPILEDFFIYKKIDNKIILEDVEFCVSHLVSFLTLQYKSIIESPQRKYFDKYVIIPKHEKYPVTTESAIWNKNYFLSKLGEDDYSAWQFEVNMCNEAKTEQGIDGLLLCDERKPINITEVPIVIQGKFYPLGISFFRSLGYSIDVSKRKIMTTSDVIKYRLKVKLSQIRFCRKQMKFIASKLFGYQFFTDD